MYDPVARKVIINHDVQFLENEAWDGTIEKTVKIIDTMEHNDAEDKVVQTPYTGQYAVSSTPGTAMQITTQNTSVRTTSAESTPRAQQTPTSSLSTSTSPYPTLTSLLPRKTRSLHDIYN
jgi:hypothetical protein